MTTGLRRPTTEAVNSRLLILPFRMDAIVHKHAVTRRQLPGDMFDVAQSGSLGHYSSPSRILRKAPFFGSHYSNADRFSAFQKRIDVRQSLVETLTRNTGYLGRASSAAREGRLTLAAPHPKRFRTDARKRTSR